MSSPNHNLSGGRRPSALLSFAIFALATGLTAYLRLYLFRDTVIALTYALPLLICLWHPDRRLLWSMAGAFSLMSAYKAIFLLPHDPASWRLFQWMMQLTNIGVVAVAIHAILGLTDQLRAKNAALESANHELQAQAEELAQQNEEISSQSEELTHQNEELQAQGEELEIQAEELQATNAELNGRDAVLQRLLRLVSSHSSHQPLREEVCHAVLVLFGDAVQCATLSDPSDGAVVVSALPSSLASREDLPPFRGSLASIVLENGRTACVHDLAARPDLAAPALKSGSLQAVLATPVVLGAEAFGVLEVYTARPHAWTKSQFKLIEWAASQCALVLEAARLRAQLLQTNTGLEQLVAERTASLQELVAELEHFSYTITHDMRAPLRAMQGFAGILAHEHQAQLNPEGAAYLDRIVRSASRMDRLITDALSYSRAIRQDLALTPVDTRRLLIGILESYPAFQAPGVEIQIDGTLPPVLANEAGLTQCFSNLLSNAVKFVAPGQKPQIRIYAESRPAKVRIWFQDNGIGISPEFQQRLFQMFQRATKDHDGTGIGLALVKKVVERMGGSVGVISELGQGSQFWMELQALPADAC